MDHLMRRHLGRVATTDEGPSGRTKSFATGDESRKVNKS